MMQRNIVCAMVCGMLAATGGATLAQGAADMPAQAPMRASYTGCLQSVNHDARFVLENAVIDGMGATAMHGQAQQMPAHAQPMPAASGAAMPMPMPSDAAMPAAGVPLTLDLRSQAQNFKKHVGQQVRVAGYGPQAEMQSGLTVEAFTVTSIKTIGKSCR